MKKKYSIIFIAFIFFLAPHVHAADLAAQPDQSVLTAYAIGGIYPAVSGIFVPSAGSVNAVKFQADIPSGSFANVVLQDVTTSTTYYGMGPSNYVSGVVDGTGTMTTYILPWSYAFSGPVTFNGTDTWFFDLFSATPLGTATNFSANGSALPSPYFEIADSGGFSGGSSFSTSTLNNVLISSPVANAVTGSTTVSVSGTYYSDSSVTFSSGSFIGIEICATQTSGTAPFTVACNPVSASTQDATTPWSTSFTLINATNYNLQAFLLYGSSRLYASSTIPISVVSNPLGTVPTTCVGSTFTCGIDDMVSYLFVPQPADLEQFSNFITIMQTKFPFAYFYEIQSTLEGLSTSDYTALPNAGVIDMHTYFPTSTLGVHKFDFFNATSLQAICNGTNGCATFIQGLIAFALWVGFAFMVYRQII